jgi:hypothetical protein
MQAGIQYFSGGGSGGGGGGSGYLLSANNLSDVANAATAATNLGLGTASNVTHGSLTLTPAANTAALTISGGSVTGSNTTTLASITGTWNTSGAPTALLVNITDTASATSGCLLLDIGTAALGSRLSVRKGQVGDSYAVVLNYGSSQTGVLSAGSNGFATIQFGNLAPNNNGLAAVRSDQVFAVRGAGAFGWENGANNPATGIIDLQIGRNAAASLRLGAADAASPVAQTLGVQSVVAGTTDTAGAAFTIAGSKGTGAGAGGPIIFQVAPAGSTGSTQNALATALTISSTGLTFTGVLTNSGGVTSYGGGAISSNTAYGASSLQSNTTGGNNSAMGANALKNNTTGGSNSAMGGNALLYNTTGNYNSAMGVNALQSNTTGGNNVAMGVSALQSNTTGSSNAAIGQSALSSNTTGNYNSAMGLNALQSNTTGSNNFAMGGSALQNNTTSNNNSAMGGNALFGNTTGSNNSAMGVNALQSNTTGGSNSAMGYQALNLLSTSVASLGSVTGGSGYTNGTYNGVQATLSSGSSATTYPTLNIVVSGGSVTSATIATPGKGFKDATTVLTVAAALIGGAGSGFTVPVATLTSSPANNIALGYNAGANQTQGAGNIVIGASIDVDSLTGSNQINIGSIYFHNRIVPSAVLGLGGSTSSYPGIKRSAATLAVRLADDSADAALTCAALTASGLLKGPASTTGSAGFNIPSGTAPTSPNDGDMWYDGTNVKFRVGGSTKTFTLV